MMLVLNEYEGGRREVIYLFRDILYILLGMRRIIALVITVMLFVIMSGIWNTCMQTEGKAITMFLLFCGACVAGIATIKS